MRVGDQIEEAVGAHERLSGRERRTRAVELLERVGIPAPERRMRDYPHQFSGGMRQRVADRDRDCRRRPKVLLADEPTTALDVIIQDQILSLLLELQRDFGMSMILVSHDLGVIAEMCDRVAVMYAGQIVELADTATLLGEPAPSVHDLAAAARCRTSNPRAATCASIGGTPPALIDVPAGCRFAPRCPLALDECRAWETELLSAGGDGHTARCWRHDEIAKEDAWPEQSSDRRDRVRAGGRTWPTCPAGRATSAASWSQSATPIPTWPRTAADRFGVGEAVTDYRRVIERDDIDVIDVVTGDERALRAHHGGARGGQARALREAGRARLPRHAARDATWRSRRGSKTKVGFTFRYSPAVRYMKELIDEGFVGTPYIYNAYEQNSQWIDPQTPLRQVARRRRGRPHRRLVARGLRRAGDRPRPLVHGRPT